MNAKREKKSFSNVVENKPTIIDCWASWCKPCIKEIPDGIKIQKKYKDKITYIYLSIDKNKTDWIKATNKFKLENSYLLINSEENKFADYFDITTIPRYIILDKNKNVYNSDAPRPSNSDELEKILKILLKK